MQREELGLGVCLSVLNVCLGVECCPVTGIRGLVYAGNDACIHSPRSR